jgi:hypothetical protein
VRDGILEDVGEAELVAVGVSALVPDTDGVFEAVAPTE